MQTDQNTKAKVDKVITPNQKWLRAKEISEIYSIGKSTIFKWVTEGKLPKGKKLSPKCTVWNREEIDNVFNEMSESSDREVA